MRAFSHIRLGIYVAQAERCRVSEGDNVEVFARWISGVVTGTTTTHGGRNTSNLYGPNSSEPRNGLLASPVRKKRPCVGYRSFCLQDRLADGRGSAGNLAVIGCLVPSAFSQNRLMPAAFQIPAPFTLGNIR